MSSARQRNCEAGAKDAAPVIKVDKRLARTLNGRAEIDPRLGEETAG